MSNDLAIATVTEVIKDEIQAAVQPISGASVTTQRPYKKAEVNNAAVNIYLYQVNPNESLRNVDLPTRNNTGTLIQQPKIAIDLSYLFSFYGDDATQEPQRLLGTVAAYIHANPVLDDQKIREVINKTSYLRGSDLDQSTEQVKFTMIPSSLKESFQLWSAFQSPYVLSATYEARVVIIESSTPIHAPPLPVSP